MWTFHSLGYLCWHSIGSRRIDCAALLMSSLLATFAYNSCDNDDIPTIYRSFSLPDSNEPLPREENKIESSAIWCIEVREAVQRDSTLSRTECVVTVGGFNEALLPSCIKNDQNSKLNRTVEFSSVFFDLSKNSTTNLTIWCGWCTFAAIIEFAQQCILGCQMVSIFGILATPVIQRRVNAFSIFIEQLKLLRSFSQLLLAPFLDELIVLIFRHYVIQCVLFGQFFYLSKNLVRLC